MKWVYLNITIPKSKAKFIFLGKNSINHQILLIISSEVPLKRRILTLLFHFLKLFIRKNLYIICISMLELLSLRTLKKKKIIDED